MNRLLKMKRKKEKEIKKEQQRPLQLCLEICCHNAVLMEMKK